MREASFAQIFEDHVSDVYGFFGYRLSTRADAEDLTQQTFERALQAFPRFDPQRASPRTWLLAIARNSLIDHFRRARFRREVALPASDRALVEAGGVAHLDQGLGIGPELADALGSLSERERELIALRYGGDLSGPEIAELTELSLANVQQILSRALRKLRARLEQRAATESAPVEA